MIFVLADELKRSPLNLPLSLRLFFFFTRFSRLGGGCYPPTPAHPRSHTNTHTLTGRGSFPFTIPLTWQWEMNIATLFCLGGGGGCTLFAQADTHHSLWDLHSPPHHTPAFSQPAGGSRDPQRFCLSAAKTVWPGERTGAITVCVCVCGRWAPPVPLHERTSMQFLWSWMTADSFKKKCVCEADFLSFAFIFLLLTGETHPCG